MSLESRPYVGTWRLGQKKLVQVTPDALVYVNGDTSIPGCPNCHGRINVQKFLTEVSVDSGVDPNAASASFTLAIPIHHTDAFARDANFILRPGLEIHIYMRGYFPVKGMFSNLADAQSVSDLKTERTTPSKSTPQKDLSGRRNAKDVEPPVPVDSNGLLAAPITRTQLQQWASALNEARTPVTEDMLMAALVAYSEEGDRGGPRNSVIQALFNRQTVYFDPKTRRGSKIKFDQGSDGSIWGLTVGTARTTGPQAGTRQFASSRLPTGNSLNRMLDNVQAVLQSRANGDLGGGIVAFDSPKDYGNPADQERKHTAFLNDFNEITSSLGFQETGPDGFRAYALQHGSPNAALAENLAVQNLSAEAKKAAPEDSDAPPSAVSNEPSLLDQYGLQGTDLQEVLAYPYYQVFHGVVTNVSHTYSGGVNTITVTCSSMLHFWQYHVLSENASVFGARPNNAGLRVSLLGHNLTGKHPYEIIYGLYRDTAGAAHGVSWVLSQKTNQAAVSEAAGESFYSLNVRYWQQRFNGRMNKLRMHGLNGELFSTAQAAVLGTASTHELLSLMRSRYADPSSFKAAEANIFSRAKSVGLGNAQRLKALGKVFAKDDKRDDVPSLELNMVEMTAFVNDLGKYGQVNLFESTYESKLDVAIKVTEVTGFEFYQDVDGDFVFKPPMYNLDTSSSRIYRLEDIDIISFNCDEGEPVATYMTARCTTGQFKNLAGTGTDNEYGVMGQYIDFRLVAQYGWRPGTFETAYFNDPRSLFYMAVNRMDLLNAPVQKASATIPIRPELRPGYPLYVQFMDCFYYCNSFAHAYSVGGQCTTNLQLIAKRAKFYAPGHVSKRGVAAIDLADTTKPERPLEVHDEQGHPRLAGFPNVVMALDPTKLNRNFLFVGSEIENIQEESTLRALLNFAATEINPPILREEPGEVGVWTMPQGPDKYVRFYFQPSDNAEPKAKTARRDKPPGEIATVNVVEAARAQAKKQASNAVEVKKLVAKLEAVRADIARLHQASQRARNEDLGAIEEKLTKAQAQATALTNQVSAMQTNQAAELEQDKTAGLGYLVKLIKTIREDYFKNHENIPSLNSTTNLLDLLGDKKSMFTNGTLPGSYRYYSSAHPDPAQQGQAEIQFQSNEDGTGGTVTLCSNPMASPTKVQGFLPNIPQGHGEAEAKFGEIPVQQGIRIYTDNPNTPHEVVSTDAIQELVFARHQAGFVKNRMSSAASSDLGGLGPNAKKSITKWFAGAVQSKPSPELSTPADIYKDSWDALWEQIRVIVSGITLPTGASTPSFPSGTFPTVVKVGNDTLPVTTSLASFKFQDSSSPAATQRFVTIGSEAWSKKYFLDQVSCYLGDQFVQQYSAAISTWYAGCLRQVPDVDPARLERTILFPLRSQVGPLFGQSVERKTRQQKKQKAKSNQGIPSPVFPISDERGYRVVGSFRYGRGITVDPDGVFDTLHLQDPLAILDTALVEQILDIFVRKKGSIKVQIPKMGPNGKPTSPPLYETVEKSGPAAKSYLEQQALAQYRARWTDSGIVNYQNGAFFSKQGQLDFSLAAWFAENSKDGIHKLPLNNAAYSLADLASHTEQNVCGCKAAEATVLLEAFGNQTYISVAGAGSGGHTLPPEVASSGEAEDLTTWLLQQNTTKAGPWKQGQDALRGAVLDRKGSALIQSFKSFVDGTDERIVALKQQQQRALDEFNASKNKIG